MSGPRRPLGEFRQAPQTKGQSLRTPPSLQRFHSLEELLKNAGYKDTRVITPDAKTMAWKASDLAAAGQPIHESRGSAALRHLEKTAKLDGHRSIKKAKSLRATDWMNSWWGPDKENESKPSASHQGSSRHRQADIPEIRLSEDPSEQSLPASLSTSTNEFSRPLPQPLSPQKHSPRKEKRCTRTSSSSLATPSSPRKSAKNRPASVRKQRNEVWIGSMAYRGIHSRSAPARTTNPPSLRLEDGPSPNALRIVSGGRSISRKQRPALGDVFGYQIPATSRDALKVTAVHTEANEPAKTAANGSSEDCTRSSTAGKHIGDSYLSQRLMSSAATPLLSDKAAVALRNEGCLRPLLTSSGSPAVRHMRSIDALRKAIGGHARKETVETMQPESDSRLEETAHPILTVTTPRGLHSPKKLDLTGLSPHSVAKYASSSSPSRIPQATRKRARRKRSSERSTESSSERSTSREDRLRKQRPSKAGPSFAEDDIFRPPLGSANRSTSARARHEPLYDEPGQACPTITVSKQERSLSNKAHADPSSSSDEDGGLMLQRGPVRDLRRAALAARPSRIPVSATGSPQARQAIRAVGDDGLPSSPTRSTHRANYVQASAVPRSSGPSRPR